MSRKNSQAVIVQILSLILLTGQTARAQFVHPGGLHTQADLDRMKAKVAVGASHICGGFPSQSGQESPASRSGCSRRILERNPVVHLG